MKIVLTLILCLVPLVASTETKCSSGLTECDSPCGSYIDYDDDGECDNIQSNLQTKTASKEIKPKPKKSNPAKKETPIQNKQNKKNL